MRSRLLGNSLLRCSLLVPLLCSAGCGSLEVGFAGELPLETAVVEAIGSSPEEPLVLAFTRRGQLTVNGELLELPEAREQAYAGLAVVDAAALPPPWRPRHAVDGGLIVSSLAKGSPLAIAGLRLFDRIDAVDGAAPASVAAVVSAVGDTELHTLAVTKLSGEAVTISARAEGKVADRTVNHVPFVFERRSAPTGDAVGVGPFDSLFWALSRKTLRYVPAAELGHASYRDRFEWGALLNLVQWTSETDPRTGETRRGLRLFWFLTIGEEL